MALRSSEHTSASLAERAQTALDRRAQLYADIDKAVAEAHAELETERANAEQSEDESSGESSARSE